jgi:glucokinase
LSHHTLLIGDIGGTNARFALATWGQAGFEHNLGLRCVDFDDIEQAIAHYLAEVGAASPDRVCLAVAGPTDGQQATLTNNPWQISAARLSRRFRGAPVNLVNDFTAIAHALPHLRTADWLDIGPVLPGEPAHADLTIGVIGPGTGLGVSALLRRKGLEFALESEGGHTGFAPETAQQATLLAALRERFPRVSNERLLSGSGLENIYWALHQVHARPFTPLSAAQVFATAEAGSDTLATESVAVFFEVLGQVAGDLALALGALDGIYIAGGMSQRYPELVSRSRFRAAFERKGRHSAYVKTIPSRLVMHANPGLLGASVLVNEEAIKTG